MRTAAVLCVIAVAALAVRNLYALHTAPSVTLATLVAGGMFVVMALALRNAPRSPPRSPARARGDVPLDPGMPKPPQGAPFRGPY